MNGEIPELIQTTSVKTTSFLLHSLDCSTLILLGVVIVTFFILTRNRRTIKKSVRKIKRKIADEGFQSLLPAPFNNATSSKPAVEELTGGQLTPGLELCHPDCCENTQWPVPSEANSSTEGSTILQEYNKTALYCRGCNGVGCVCSKK